MITGARLDGGKAQGQEQPDIQYGAHNFQHIERKHMTLRPTPKGATMTAEPINLMTRFGKQYRIAFDPGYDPKHRPKDKLDPWAMEIPCERGTIYPHGGNDLAVMVDYRPITARKLAAIPGVVLVQDGDQEKTFVFPVELFKTVAKAVKPRRKRRLTAEQKQKAAERLKAFRFPSRSPERSQEAPRPA